MTIPSTRIEAFSDGVFAIILTLLVWQLRVPYLTENATLGKNLGQLAYIVPKFISFVLSFVFVAIFWVNHHQLYHTVKTADRALLWHNMHLLFWLCVIPFPTAILGDHPAMPLAAMCLGFVLMMAGLTAYIMRKHYYLHLHQH